MGSMTPIISKGIGLASALSGGVLPGLSIATQALGLYSAVDENKKQKAEQQQALTQLRQQQALAQSQRAADVALQKQQIATQAEQDAQERRAALRRAVARQRASFGSQGVGSGSGSSQAVLLGLFDQSEEEQAQAERLSVLKTAALDQGISQNASLNLLQQQQLQEKQKLARLYL